MKRYIFTIALSLCSIFAFSQKSVTVYDDNTGKEEVIELPEGMQEEEIDSMMRQWFASTHLTYDSTECESSGQDIEYSDEEYILRLQRLPNIIEMPYNKVVRKFIDQYTGRLRRSTALMLGACNFYTPIFEEALEAYQLPLELKYLPIVESALNPNATSRVGAGGLWQFMPATGKRYGLETNSLIDERRDPIKASYAAAQMLKNLYDIFGDWTLAIASYNCGPANVSKAIKRAGGERDYWKIYPYLLIAVAVGTVFYGIRALIDRKLPAEQRKEVIGYSLWLIIPFLFFSVVSTKLVVLQNELSAIQPDHFLFFGL